MKLCILDNGNYEGDANYMSAMTTFGTVDQPHAPSSWIRIPIYCVLVEHEGRYLLYDTGIHPDTMCGHMTEEQNRRFPYYHTPQQELTAQLALAGITPAQVDTVVLSHLHYDHAGNLHLFQHADVYVPEADFAYALCLTHSVNDPEAHVPYVRDDVNQYAKQFHVVGEDTELWPGLKLLYLPGHAPGLLGMQVTLPQEGTLIFPSDAVNNAKNYGPPIGQTTFAYDVRQYQQSIRRVHQLAEKAHARVMFSHDMPFFEQLKHAPEWYR